MNFKQATLGQLHLIASAFEDCPTWMKELAAAEINRRKKKRFTRLQAREKRTK